MWISFPHFKGFFGCFHLNLAFFRRSLRNKRKSYPHNRKNCGGQLVFVHNYPFFRTFIHVYKSINLQFFIRLCKAVGITFVSFPQYCEKNYLRFFNKTERRYNIFLRQSKVIYNAVLFQSRLESASAMVSDIL